MVSRSRALRVWVLLFAVLVQALPARGQEAAGRPLRVGFMTHSFSGVDVREARLATEIWLEQVADTMDEEVVPQSVTFSSRDAVAEALRAGRLDVMSMGSLDYLEIRGRTPLEPFLVIGSAEGNALAEYVLLVHRDEAPESLAQLRGKRIRIGSRRPGLANMWLDVLLGRDGLPQSHEFFGAVEREARVAHTVLPVFFKQIAACLVDQRSFAEVCDANPQVGESVVVWARSPGLLPGLTCFRPDFDAEMKESIRQAALRLHTQPAGRQLLTLFRSQRAMPFEPGQLGGVLQLVDDYGRTRAPAEGEE